MYEPDSPYQTEEPKKGGHGHAHHHLSPWAIWIGFTAPIFAIGIATGGAFLVVGAILLSFGIYGWIREDYLEFPKGPNPLTQHTQGEKDNGWWGIVLFLATEVVLFGSLFAVWFGARASSDIGWPPAGTPTELPIFETGINTIILVASGFVMMWGEKGLLKGNRKRFIWGFVGAIGLGLVFLYNQVLEYKHLIHEDFVLSTNIYTTSFYALTGTHGIHVAGGLVFLIIILIRGALGQFDAKRHSALAAAAYYWHFVDIVWLILYAVVYLEWV